MQPSGSRTHGHLLAVAPAVEEVDELGGGGQFELVVELFEPGGVGPVVAGGDPVGHRPAGGVFELQAQGDLGVGFLAGDDRHRHAEHVRADQPGRDGLQAGRRGAGVDAGDERVDVVPGFDASPADPLAGRRALRAGGRRVEGGEDV
ncbi:hypothetical protein [Dactylosporangium sp. NPDC049140]|uniref:hypothetical protein n=1 Tax=Dactylosporangium sp. NPDC049140 TaxID=3155647 RepID=UPI0033D10059